MNLIFSCKCLLFIWFVTEGSQQAGMVLYTPLEQPSVLVLPNMYLHSLQYQLTLLLTSVYSPVGFLPIGTQRKTWGRTSVGIPTTIPVVRGATPQTPTYGPRSVASRGVPRVRQTTSLYFLGSRTFCLHRLPEDRSLDDGRFLFWQMSVWPVMGKNTGANLTIQRAARSARGGTQGSRTNTTSSPKSKLQSW